MSTSMWPRAAHELEEIDIPPLETEPRWETYYENVLETIEGKATQIVTHAQIRKDMQVLMAAFESARTNTIVKLNDE